MAGTTLYQRYLVGKFFAVIMHWALGAIVEQMHMGTIIVFKNPLFDGSSAVAFIGLVGIAVEASKINPRPTIKSVTGSIVFQQMLIVATSFFTYFSNQGYLGKGQKTVLVLGLCFILVDLFEFAFTVYQWFEVVNEISRRAAQYSFLLRCRR